MNALSSICLFVPMMATAYKNDCQDLHEFTSDVSFDKEVTNKFWKSSGSRSGNFCEGLLPLQHLVYWQC